MRVKHEVQRAVATVPFYNDLYTRAGFDPRKLRGFDDVQSIPVVTKAQLMACPLEQRSRPTRGSALRNTGGSSGATLHFRVDADSFAREYAHMHVIWESLGYRPACLKLALRGGHLGGAPWKYHPRQNEIALNMYHSWAETCDTLRRELHRERFRYLHGYPSLIADFARHLETHDTDIRDALRESLRGIFLSSEFPSPPHRELIERVFGAPSVSWYGHGEKAILAWEQASRYEYVPFITYGHAEAIPDGEGSHRLIGTAFGNRSHPFIRYDTGDRVEPVGDPRCPRAFRISHGRASEYIADRAGHSISLTALIFGRHHEIFNRARHLQVYQPAPGRVWILATLSPEDRRPVDWSRAFDSSHVSAVFAFGRLDEAVRLPNGKTPLLLKAPPAGIRWDIPEQEE